MANSLEVHLVSVDFKMTKLQHWEPEKSRGEETGLLLDYHMGDVLLQPGKAAQELKQLWDKAVLCQVHTTDAILGENKQTSWCQDYSSTH